MVTRSAVRCAIIAGGSASRMGGAPKGLLEVAGRRTLDRLVEQAVLAFGELPLLVANAPDAARWRPELDMVADRIPGAGPLGGLYTAIMAGPAPVVCVAWDLPFVPHQLLTALATGLRDYDAFLPESGGPRGVEPLCAGYRPHCATAIRAAIDGGNLSAVGWHQAVKVGRLDLAAVSRFGPPGRLFFNLNTPEDVVSAEALARPNWGA